MIWGRLRELGRNCLACRCAVRARVAAFADAYPGALMHGVGWRDRQVADSQQVSVDIKAKQECMRRAQYPRAIGEISRGLPVSYKEVIPAATEGTGGRTL